jgi:valyl-tRNA synthetase
VELKKLSFHENSGLTPGWRNTLAAFETALRLLHPAMPFLTEELWQRLAAGGAGRPKSIAIAAYPQYNREGTDFAAEREIGILQEIVGMARTLRAEAKLDPKQRLDGALYSRSAALEVAERHVGAIQALANVKLEFLAGSAPKAAVSRSTSEFDLVLHLPQGQQEAQARRVAKEREQLVKNIANLIRQLGDEKFLASAPAHVVESMRKKLADYKAQLEKLDGAV